MGRIFRRFPQLNVSEMARYIGINKSLLAKYIYGIPAAVVATRQSSSELGIAFAVPKV